jgi:hypothetical protein
MVMDITKVLKDLDIKVYGHPSVRGGQGYGIEELGIEKIKDWGDDVMVLAEWGPEGATSVDLNGYCLYSITENDISSDTIDVWYDFLGIIEKEYGAKELDEDEISFCVNKESYIEMLDDRDDFGVLHGYLLLHYEDDVETYVIPASIYVEVI